MPIDHHAHAPAIWKTTLVASALAFVAFVVAWLIYLAQTTA